MKIKQFNNLKEGTEVIHYDTDRIGKVVRTSSASGLVLVLFEGGDKEWVEYFKLELYE